jgi:3-isopropylmalate/(R)-2-methylmalate dehydratase small subunit
MMQTFGGKALFLDRADINTDEIIPAKYLTEISKEALAPHLLEDLKMEGFSPARDLAGVRVLVTRGNFGCGSSREHAPWALEVNGITAVIAPGFARIFRQNMFNNGMLAIELPEEEIDRLFRQCAACETSVEIDFPGGRAIFVSAGKRLEVPFTVSGFDRELVESGGWIPFADKRY